VEYICEAEGAAQVGLVFQLGGDTAVVGLAEGLEGQAGEELAPGELLGVEAVRIRREGKGGDGLGLPGHAQRGFG